MDTYGSDEITSDASQRRSDGLFLSFLRAAALTALMVGAVGSIGLTLRAGRTAPRLLLVLFIVWVLLPYVALAWANRASKSWAVFTQTALYCVTLVVMLGSLAIYGGIISPPVGSPHAFVFVAVPLGSWLLIAVIVLIAALISRRRSLR